MKDEIKEMCHKCKKYPAEYNQTYCEFCLGISNKDDYITNLQEENKRLKKDNYLLIDYQDMEIRYNEYKQRIDKAIEMFNNETLNKYYYGMSYEFEINDFKEDILNILQGKSDE